MDNDNLTVSDEIASDNSRTMFEFAARMFNHRLAALRAQNPFVEIEQWPEPCTYVLTANQSKDINIPTHAKMMRFSGNGNYFVTRNGNAFIPTGDKTDNGDGVVFKPEWAWFHCEEIRSVSVIAQADMVLTVSFISQQ